MQDFLDNDPNITTSKYAVILGLTPSRGARSPLLWNAAFKAACIDAAMVPMDVTPANLAGLVAALKADKRYIGGAVAVPHKQAIAALLDRLEPEAERIGAVNAIYRDGDDLVGANTDGAGALSQIEDALPDLASRKAVLIGLGGAGIAVAAYLAGAVKELAVANRTEAKAKEAAIRLGDNVSSVPLPLTTEQLSDCGVLVNCTTAGYQDGPAGTPLGAEADTLITALPSDALVYDIIYQPLETELLGKAAARGLKTRNGLGMNLDQAVIAFQKANPGALTIDRVRDAMRNAG
ncbi:shikimate dehydrogenase [Nisaea acidiphila]|uniref:shikimate dehydrogenase (NADP(+)) n=1 Tax=Nisaea acidiphila TaxID=1862145 RepID=A0A9J7ALL7_9PROT|nr:shikimate dehydrogenase [Nisaea acidiphila]UUX48368.1 shikimate dehydrogenase [Nisaea acidiphila]